MGSQTHLISSTLTPLSRVSPQAPFFRLHPACTTRTLLFIPYKVSWPEALEVHTSHGLLTHICPPHSYHPYCHSSGWLPTRICHINFCHRNFSSPSFAYTYRCLPWPVIIIQFIQIIFSHIFIYLILIQSLPYKWFQYSVGILFHLYIYIVITTVCVSNRLWLYKTLTIDFKFLYCSRHPPCRSMYRAIIYLFNEELSIKW